MLAGPSEGDHLAALSDSILVDCSSTFHEQDDQYSDSQTQDYSQVAGRFDLPETPLLWPEEILTELEDDTELGLSLRTPSLTSVQLEMQRSHQDAQMRTFRQQGQNTNEFDRRPHQTQNSWITTEYEKIMPSRELCILSDALMPEKILNTIPPTYIGGPELSTKDRELLHHYRTRVCEAMMPTLAPAMNPYLRLYLPLAIQAQNSPSKDALLHAMLAVAALNRAQLAPAHLQQYREQATKHHDQATSRIHQIIATKQAAPQQGEASVESKYALLAAAIMMTTIDVRL